MNYFGMSEDHVRYKISFQNLLMLFDSIPKYDRKSKEGKENEKKLSSVAGTLKAAGALGLKVKNKDKDGVN